jgi:hypothetical protein
MRDKSRFQFYRCVWRPMNHYPRVSFNGLAPRSWRGPGSMPGGVSSMRKPPFKIPAAAAFRLTERRSPVTFPIRLVPNPKPLQARRSIRRGSGTFKRLPFKVTLKSSSQGRDPSMAKTRLGLFTIRCSSHIRRASSGLAADLICRTNIGFL